MKLTYILLPLLVILAGCDSGVGISPKPAVAESKNNYLGETYSVTGFIADAGGANVGVTLSGVNGIGSVQIDADGGYTFLGVRPGNYVVSAAREGAYFVPATQAVSVTDANVTVPTTGMQRSLRVSGSIMGVRPFDVVVKLSQEGARDRSVVTAVTGEFEFTNLLPGKYTLTPQPIGCRFEPINETFELTDNDNRGVVFNVIPTNKSIYGKISGAAVSGVTITAEMQNGSGEKSTIVSNDLGEYSLLGLKPGNYVVTPALGNFLFTPDQVVVQIGFESQTEANFISSRREKQCKDGWCTPWDVENYELVSIFGFSGSDIWASGERSALLRYTSPSVGSNAAWFPNALNTGAIVLAGIWGSGTKDVWIVGSQGTILSNTGNGWTKVSSPTESDLLAVSGTSSNLMWAVGANGTMLRYSNGKWEVALPAPTKQTLNGIWAAKNGDWWAVGANGTIFTYHGAGWVQETSPTKNNLNAVWGKDEKTVWAVGDKGTILRRINNVWSGVESGTDVNLFGVWAGASDTDVWAVGTRSTVLRYGPVTGSPVPAWKKLVNSMDLGDLRSVWSAGDGTLWMAGNRGVFSYTPP